MDLTDRLELEHPVVQAGMGGGLAAGRLAGEVSAAGGLGTVGLLAPDLMRAELLAARERADGRPVAANLLTEFTKRAHVEAVVAAKTEVTTLHGPADRGVIQGLHEGGGLVLATVGTPEDAAHALRQGADGLVVQGVEAGGHIVGTEPALTALEKIKSATDAEILVLAGGIAEAGDTRLALEAGAGAVVAGTRFLLTHEAGAHEGYKQRILEADRTLETLLFSVGWPLRHRVIPNAATDRWCTKDPLGPPAAVRLASLSFPLLCRLPASAADALSAVQRPWIPLFGPAAPVVGMPDSRLDATALYAGETATRLSKLTSAAEAVAELSP